MKKVFLFFAIALFFASCAPKAAEETVVEEAVVETVDSIAVDSIAVDSIVSDSVAVVAE